LFANLISDMAYQNLRLVRAHMIQEQTSRALQASESRLQHLSSKLILTQEEERRQLAAELHDGIGQSLTAVKFSIDNILLNLENPNMDIRKAIRSASQIIKDSIGDVRRMQVELRPRILDELGIIATINWFCREFRSIYSHIDLEIRVDVTEDQVAGHLKPVVFRIIQEAFNNAAKYCEGDRMDLSFIDHKGCLTLEIRDNGIGFDLDEVLSSRELNRGLGLDSMRERAELCNGEFEIFTGPGEGTCIRASWDSRPHSSQKNGQALEKPAK
jgi:signal transduction histidine kinase